MGKTIARFILYILNIMIIKILIDLIFLIYISDKWSYTGFYVDYNGVKYLFSIIVIILIGFILSLLNKSIVNFFYILITIAFFVPFSSLFGLMNKSWYFYILGSLIFILLGLFLNLLTEKNYSRNINSDNLEASKPMLIILFFVSLYTLLIMSIQNIGNVSLSTLINLKEVYDIRENATYNLGMNYFYSWQTKVINPFLLIYFFKKKSKLGVISISIFQTWLFLLTGHKLVLFNLLVTILILIFIRKKFIQRLSIVTIISINIVLIISALEIFITKNSFIVDYFVRRVFLVPAQISYYYYEHFSINSFRYWQDTIFYRIFNIDSDGINTSNIIGEIYFGSKEVNAVSGFLGAEYANAGILGLLLALIILFIIFFFINKFSLTVDTKVIIIVFISPIYSLWNSAILTTVLTGGMALAIVIISQIRNEKKHEDFK